ncbi:MAG TPA: 2-dehydropantoate 2-reductase [Sphingomicrobium sp.]
MNICVIGAGAIGGWVAARLVLAGEAVMALASRGALDSVEIVQDGETKSARLMRFDEPADILIIAVKATSLSAAATSARMLIGPDTIIVPMLNGVPWWFVDGLQLRSIDPDGGIAAALPVERLIGCVVHASCSRSGEAVIVKHADKLLIGEPNGENSERLARLVALFERARLRPEQTADVRRAIWYKLWGNATLNPLSALTRAATDRLLANPESRSWMLEGMAELAAIGAAIGCPVSESGEDRTRVTERLGAFKTSMLQDVEAGRPIELEALLGAPREIARARAIETPALDRLYEVTKLMAESLGLY